MKNRLPVILSINAGLVDTAGFIALDGLFTAHVTGNFVTLGAVFVEGSEGALAKMLALPVFCAVIFASYIIATIASQRSPRYATRLLFIIIFILLSAAALTALTARHELSVQQTSGIITGMLLVSGMAIQNALHRLFLTDLPPSTLMTGTTTQVVLDVALLLIKRESPERRQVARARLKKLFPNILGFAGGCCAGAGGFIIVHAGVFVIPPVLMLIALRLYK